MPDLRGTFLRGAGNFVDDTKDTVLGGFQSDTTKKNSLGITGSIGNTLGVSNPSHLHTAYRQGFHFPTSGDVWSVLVPGDVGQGTANIGSTTTAVSLTGSVDNGTLDVSAGDSETRPQNVGMNFIIKLFD